MVVDPCCGVGTIPIEAAAAFPGPTYIAGGCGHGCVGGYENVCGWLWKCGWVAAKVCVGDCESVV